MTRPASKSPRQPASKIRLKVVHSDAEEWADRELEFEGGAVHFGRVEGDVVVPDPAMSGRHASLEIEGTKLILKDNNSSNGVWLDGTRIEEAETYPGAQFQLGSTTFEILSSTTEPLPIDSRTQVVGGTVMVSDFKDLVAQFESPEALEALGEPIIGAANEPFFLSDASSMWLLVSGELEVFTVKAEGGKPVGARSHFVSIKEGSAAFGIETDTLGFDSGFLAVPRAGSMLRKYDLEKLQFYAPVPEHRGRIAELVKDWVTQLSRRLTADLPSIPKAKATLVPGETLDMPTEGATMSGNEVVWVEMPAAQLLFDGMASISYEAEGLLFPLAPGSWLELLGQEESIPLEPRSTAEVITDPRAWAGLELFHRVLAECELLNKRFQMADEFHRLQRKAERAEEAREAGVGAIESVLGGTRKFERGVFGAGSGPIFEACAIVAREQGIEAKRPVGDLEELSFDETVQAMATASRIRTRRIAMVDDWWNRDQGPLVGQHQETNAPVALLPKGPKSYEIFDPATGESEALTEDRAAELLPFAYSFYRTFPDGVIGARDLIRFGTFGLKREFRETALMGIATGLLGMVTPMITGMVFDSSIPQAERAFLVQLCAGLGMVALGSALFKVVQNFAMLRVQSKMDYSVQAAVWDRLLDLPATFFKDYSAGDLADRASAVDKIRAIIAGAGVGAILGSFASLFNAVQMSFYSMAMAGVAIGLTLLYVLFTTTCNYLKLRLQRREFHRRGLISGLVLQLINGVAKLRVSGTEDHAFRAWATEFAGMRRTAFAVGRIGNFIPVLNAGFPVFFVYGDFLHHGEASTEGAGER